jgi:hypothetical protein
MNLFKIKPAKSGFILSGKVEMRCMNGYFSQNGEKPSNSIQLGNNIPFLAVKKAFLTIRIQILHFISLIIDLKID